MMTSNKKTILSAGLSPAWQQVMVFREFRYGEVNRAAEVHWHAQGKVVNAGIAAHHLGGPSLILSPIGGPARAAMDRELDELGTPRRWIETRAATRICTTILDQSKDMMTELIEECRPLLSEELDAYRRAFAEEAARAGAVIITGSLPTGTPPTFYRELLERTPCPAVLDFRGEGLLASLDLKPFAVKPNREELAQTVGRDLNDEASLLDAMRSLNHRGAQGGGVPQGSRPPWLTSATDAYRLHSLPIEKVVNPLGSGDSMAAAIAWAIRDGRAMIEAVQLGIAAAAENLAQLHTGRLDPAAVQRRACDVRVDVVK